MNTLLQSNLTDYARTLLPPGVDARIVHLERLSFTLSSEVYRFTLHYDEAGLERTQTFVIKLYANTPDGMDRALKERHVLFHLRGVHYPVPGVLAVEIEKSPLERPFVIMEYIEGQTFAEAFGESDPSRRAELVGQFVNLMTDLHGRNPTILVSRIGTPSALAMINREIYTMRGLATTYQLTEYLPLMDWLYSHRAEVPCDTPAITHRDFVPSNIILSRRGMPYVIDWAWQIGDPRYDLAWALLALRREGQSDLAAEILAEYERVNGGIVQGLAIYEVLVSVRWLMGVNQELRGLLGQAKATEHAALMMSRVEPVRQALAFIEAQTGLRLPTAEALLV